MGKSRLRFLRDKLRKKKAWLLRDHLRGNLAQHIQSPHRKGRQKNKNPLKYCARSRHIAALSNRKPGVMTSRAAASGLIGSGRTNKKMVDMVALRPFRPRRGAN